MMKRLLAFAVLVTLLIPNIAFAKAEDYGTIIWEGYLANNNYGGEAAKVRFTITGVVGEQVSEGKVNTYEKLLYWNSPGGKYPQHIIPVVDGGSVKVEYLGDEASKNYQDAEGVMGVTVVKEIKRRTYGDKELYVDSGYISPAEFYVNEDFYHDVGKYKHVDYSELSYNNLKNKNYIGQIYLPLSADGWGDTLLQIVSETQAKKMLAEIKNGHDTIQIGKTFNETTEQENIWDPKFPEINKSALEDKYGIKISVEDGFLDEQAALSMIERMYGTFPDGLIKEITSYYKSKGINTYVKFVYKQTNLGGAFSDKGSNVTLYYYPDITDKFGDWVIAHEMGHYVHKYLNAKYGYNKLKSEWTSLNDGFEYNKDEWSDIHRDYFVRNYSLTNYSEDVATLFEWLASENNWGIRKQYFEQEDKAILKKIDLLNNVLLESTNSVTNLKNIWGTIYPQAPSSYAANTCDQAREAGIIPEGDIDDSRFIALYQSKITREDFSILAVNLIEKATDMTIAEYCKQKGVKVDWYLRGSISGAPAEDGSEQFRTRSNYPFYDVSSRDIFDLHTLGVINGKSDKIFDPNGYLTREQAAVILRNIASVLNQDTTAIKSQYSDDSSISSWAKTGVDYVSSNGLMGGTGNNSFSPKANINYEQSFIILYNLFTKLK